MPSNAVSQSVFHFAVPYRVFVSIVVAFLSSLCCKFAGIIMTTKLAKKIIFYMILFSEFGSLVVLHLPNRLPSTLKLRTVPTALGWVHAVDEGGLGTCS